MATGGPLQCLHASDATLHWHRHSSYLVGVACLGVDGNQDLKVREDVCWCRRKPVHRFQLRLHLTDTAGFESSMDHSPEPLCAKLSTSLVLRVPKPQCASVPTAVAGTVHQIACQRCGRSKDSGDPQLVIHWHQA